MKVLIFILLLLVSFSTKEESIKNEGCLKLDIILLADMSSSVDGHETFIHDAMKSFIDRFELSEEGVRIGLIRFADTAYLLSGLTTDKQELYYGLRSINPTSAYGSTEMADAIKLSADEFLKNGRPLIKKIVVIISDGAPNSKQDARNAASYLKSIDSTIICGVFVSSKVDQTFLQEISSEFCYVESNYETLVEELKKLDICF